MRKIGSCFCIAFVSISLLVGCARPPQTELDKVVEATNGLSIGPARTEIESQVQGVRDELKKQEGKLFKDYDNAKSLIARIDSLIQNPSQIAVRSEDPKRTDVNRFRISYFTGPDQYSKDVVLVLDTASGKEIFGIRGFGMIELSRR
ncbi:hypothetical protein EPO05_04345 [Patescibacteria group bacterium]|nr:MAG: hypothetical protein EPO05_04345 [Patescibacteria group bacterium]